MHLLQFSGGIDSLATLLLLRDTPDLSVLTVLPDGAYPETIDYLLKVEAKFPTVRFIVSHTKRSLEQYGQPVDVVPLKWTALGQLIRGGKDIRYQDSFSCCNRAIWQPLDRVSRELGATVIYRGQRNDDEMRDPVQDGVVIDGVQMRFPIADWTREQSFGYVKAWAPDLMPPGYGLDERTSRDCWDCTAYLGDNRKRIENLPTGKNARVNVLLAQWRDDVLTEMEN